jgi:hypothetical protein
MAKSPTQRLNEHDALLVEINGMIDILRQEAAGMRVEQQQTASSVAGFETAIEALGVKVTQLQAWKDSIGSFADMKAEIAVLKERIDDLKGWKDDQKRRSEEWGRKLWMIVPVLIGVILTFLLGYYVGKQ